MREYTFDIKLSAVVRIKAESRSLAEATLTDGLECAELVLSLANADGISQRAEASVHVDDVDYPYLIEVDGQDVQTDEDEAPQ